MRDAAASGLDFALLKFRAVKGFEI